MFSLYLNWLNKTDLESRNDLWTYFDRHRKYVSKAMRNLNQINELKIPDEDYKLFVDAIDESGFLFKPKIKYPRIIYRIDNLIESFAIQFRIRKTELKKLFNIINIEIPNYEIHKNQLHSVVNADLVLNDWNQTEVDEYIRKNYKVTVRKVYNQGKKETHQKGIVNLLPLGFARISVYSTLMRKRTYSNYGIEKELICILKYKKLSRIRCPGLYEAEIENHGLYSIEWNKKWLEEKGKKINSVDVLENDRGKKI